MRQLRSTICQAVSQSLINRNCSPRCLEMDWPGSRKRRFGRIVETERDAEFALLAIRVLFERSSAQIRSHVDIRWLERLARHLAERCSNLMMKKSGHRIVVDGVTPRTLTVSQRNGAGPNLLPIVAASS